jgi:Na+/phosphate symporter
MFHRPLGFKVFTSWKENQFFFLAVVIYYLHAFFNVFFQNYVLQFVGFLVMSVNTYKISPLCQNECNHLKELHHKMCFYVLNNFFLIHDV